MNAQDRKRFPNAAKGTSPHKGAMGAGAGAGGTSKGTVGTGSTGGSQAKGAQGQKG